MFIGFSFTANSQCIMNFKIGEKGTAEFDNPDYGDYQYELTNKSFKPCSVKIVDRNSGEIIRGFDLDKRTTSIIDVPANGKVLVTNDSKGKVKIKGEMVSKLDVARKSIIASSTDAKGNKVTASASTTNDEDYVQLNLINNSDKDISLIIPKVMNPNLLPNSKSGVCLKVGQKVYFKAYGKKYELFEVNSNINEGEDLNIAALVKRKKYELGFY